MLRGLCTRNITRGWKCSCESCQDFGSGCMTLMTVLQVINLLHHEQKRKPSAVFEDRWYECPKRKRILAQNTNFRFVRRFISFVLPRNVLWLVFFPFLPLQILNVDVWFSSRLTSLYLFQLVHALNPFNTTNTLLHAAMPMTYQRTKSHMYLNQFSFKHTYTFLYRLPLPSLSIVTLYFFPNSQDFYVSRLTASPSPTRLNLHVTIFIFFYACSHSPLTNFLPYISFLEAYIIVIPSHSTAFFHPSQHLFP